MLSRRTVMKAHTSRTRTARQIMSLYFIIFHGVSGDFHRWHTLYCALERSVIVCETANFSVDQSWLSQQPLEKTTGSQLYLSEKVATQEKEIIEAAL
jgi:hypothetical protein